MGLNDILGIDSGLTLTKWGSGWEYESGPMVKSARVVLMATVVGRLLLDLTRGSSTMLLVDMIVSMDRANSWVIKFINAKDYRFVVAYLEGANTGQQ